MEVWLAGGGIFLVFSLGLYQAWIAFAVTLVIVHLILESKETEKDKKKIVTAILRNMLMGIYGIVCYLLSVKVFNAVFGLSLYSYKGLDSMGSIKLSEIPERISNCYKAFFEFMQGKYYAMSNTIVILNYVVLVLILLMSLFVLINQLKNKNFLYSFFFVIFILALPMGTCFMELVANTDTLSIYANCIVYVLLVKYCDDWVENTETPRVKIKKIFSACIYTVSVIMVFFFFFLTQVYYQKVHVFYQRTYALANRIVMRIEELDEYPQVKKVAVVGDMDGYQGHGTSQTIFSDVVINDRGLHNQFIGIDEATSSYQLKKFVSFMNGFLGTDFINVELDEAKEKLRTDDYFRMPVWPNRGSVQAIGDAIFVKMNHYRWLEMEEKDGKYQFRLRAEEQNDVCYLWQIFKDEEKVLHELKDEDTFEVVLEDAGTYFARVYIKDAESKISMITVTGDKFVIE